MLPVPVWLRLRLLKASLEGLGWLLEFFLPLKPLNRPTLNTDAFWVEFSVWGALVFDCHGLRGMLLELIHFIIFQTNIVDALLAFGIHLDYRWFRTLVLCVFATVRSPISRINIDSIAYRYIFLDVAGLVRSRINGRNSDLRLRLLDQSIVLQLREIWLQSGARWRVCHIILTVATCESLWETKQVARRLRGRTAIVLDDAHFFE